MTLHANLVDIPQRRIYPARIGIESGRIAAITPLEEACETFVLPGFIDAHIHIESSMLIPSQFARLAVLHGTVATVSDPHEIANVLGVEGVEFMLEDAAKVPFKFHFGASPCVPATPFETSGAGLTAEDVEALLQRPDIYFLSEVMNFPGVLNGDPDMTAKLAAAKNAGKPVDGHAPGLHGEELQRYIFAGITTDHEAFTLEEAREKLELGMKIIIREGSAARNFDALEPLIDDYAEEIMFCSDDRHPDDLMREHINALVVRSLQKGHNLFNVLQIACLNPIAHYGLDVGQLRVGDAADFIEVADLTAFEVLRTVIGGVTVAEHGKSIIAPEPAEPFNIFRATPKSAADFLFKQPCKSVEVIGVIDGELVTEERIFHLPSSDGNFTTDPSQDILKIAVVNRYEERAPFVAFVQGFGLKEGAIASSVAHDSHNIVAVGCSDEALARAVNLIIEQRGGVSAVTRGTERLLGLEVAGIMSAHDAFDVARRYSELDAFAKTRLGSPLGAPFMSLSFMALLVIPSLKISDRGLFDTDAFHFIHRCKVRP